MIEWVLAVVGGVFLIMMMYSSAFITLQFVAKRRVAISKRLSSSMWFSNVIVGPVLLGWFGLVLILISGGDFSAWSFVIPDPISLLIVLVIGLLIAFAVVISSSLVERRKGFTDSNTIRGKSDVLLFILLVVILASVTEELVFRALLQQMIDNALLLSVTITPITITSGAIISALIFGAIHAMPAKQMGRPVAPMVIGSFVLGIVAGISLTVLGSIIVPILIHVEFNVAGLIVSRLMPGAPAEL